jgi:hypothetical protein
MTLPPRHTRHAYCDFYFFALQLVHRGYLSSLTSGIWRIPSIRETIERCSYAALVGLRCVHGTSTNRGEESEQGECHPLQCKSTGQRAQGSVQSGALIVQQARRRTRHAGIALKYS